MPYATQTASRHRESQQKKKPKPLSETTFPNCLFCVALFYHVPCLWTFTRTIPMYIFLHSPHGASSREDRMATVGSEPRGFSLCCPDAAVLLYSVLRAVLSVTVPLAHCTYIFWVSPPPVVPPSTCPRRNLF